MRDDSAWDALNYYYAHPLPPILASAYLEADPSWETHRESTIYFDKLWLSEIGIKY